MIPKMGCCLLTLAVLMAVGPLGCWAGRKWWQNTVIYEIYPQSFYDSDGDGMGDLIGIKEKADYLAELGIGAVWCNPFYKSPLKDNGYDVSDFRAIDPRFGTMEHFESLVSLLKSEHSIEFIMDFVPNHTSDQHEWFQKSVDRIDPYTDYYVWKDPKRWDNGRPVPPNNWESIFIPGQAGSAWTWNDKRQQFYYHGFMVEQPDLNFRNKAVIEELKDTMKFWMDKGVSGFRMDAVPHLLEDEEMRDEHDGNHEYTQNLPGTYEVIQEFRAYLDEYSEENDVDIFLTTEGYAGADETMRYYGNDQSPGAHFPFNFLLLTNFNAETDARSLSHTIQNYLGQLKNNQFPNWVSGNHDWPRIPSRLGATSATDIMNMLNLLLPGTATVYMGDEIGMDSYWNLDKSQCPAGVGDDYRTPGRTPFHWSTAKNAGFTASDKPWVPVNPEYYRANVESQRGDYSPNPFSHLKNFKRLMDLKKTRTFTDGQTTTYALTDNILAVTRHCPRYIYVVLVNLGKSFGDTFNIKKEIPALRRAVFQDVEVKSVNMAKECNCSESCLELVMSGNWSMPPKSGLVLSFMKYGRTGSLRRKRSNSDSTNGNSMPIWPPMGLMGQMPPFPPFPPPPPPPPMGAMKNFDPTNIPWWPQH